MRACAEATRHGSLFTHLLTDLPSALQRLVPEDQRPTAPRDREQVARACAACELAQWTILRDWAEAASPETYLPLLLTSATSRLCVRFALGRAVWAAAHVAAGIVEVSRQRRALRRTCRAVPLLTPAQRAAPRVPRFTKVTPVLPRAHPPLPDDLATRDPSLCRVVVALLLALGLPSLAAAYPRGRVQ